MIICVCKNVKSSQIAEAIAEGMTLDDITRELGLGTGCGRCLDYVLTHIPELSNEVAALSLA